LSLVVGLEAETPGRPTMAAAVVAAVVFLID
jgi:hypothetical protein